MLDTQKLENLAMLLWGRDWRMSHTIDLIEGEVAKILVENTKLNLENKMLRDRGDEFRELLVRLLGGDRQIITGDNNIKPILPKDFGMNEIKMKDIPQEVQSFFKGLIEKKGITNLKIIDKNPKKEILDILVKNLKLSDRVSFALVRNDIRTVEDLIKISKEKLSKLRSIGPKGIAEIEEKMKELGLKPREKYNE